MDSYFFVCKIRYKYFFGIISFLNISVDSFDIPGFFKPYFYFSYFSFNSSILSIFFLVCSLSSISSPILFGLPQNLFFNVVSLRFYCNNPNSSVFSVSISSNLLFISKSLTILILSIFPNIAFKVIKLVIKSLYIIKLSTSDSNFDNIIY